MLMMALFAGFFAWFSSAYHESQRQAAAVDELISQGVFVMLEPRQSLAVSILPGTPEEPPRAISKTLGNEFFRSATNVSTRNRWNAKMDKDRVLSGIAKLSDLRRLRLTKLSLSTNDLNRLSGLTELAALDLSRTRLDRGSVDWLQHTQLHWFDASHTWLGDNALRGLSRCPDLQYLNMERSTITDAGLQHLYGMSGLRYLNLKRCTVTPAAVKKLSAAIPNCLIQFEPLVLNNQGQTYVMAARRGFMQLGTPTPVDPRKSKLATPPIDGNQTSSQTRSPYNYSPFPYPQQRSPRSYPVLPTFN